MLLTLAAYVDHNQSIVHLAVFRLFVYRTFDASHMSDLLVCDQHEILTQSRSAELHIVTARNH